MKENIWWNRTLGEGMCGSVLPLPSKKVAFHCKLERIISPGDTGLKENIFLPLLGFVLKKYGLLSKDVSWTDFSTEIYKPLL